MRQPPLIGLTLAAAAWLLGCDASRPFEPSPEAGGGGPAANAGGPVLPAPSNATAAANGWDQAVVRWQDNSGETGFEIERATTQGGPFVPRATVGANIVVFNDSGFDLLLQYCYRIRAVRVARNKVSYSAFSNVVCVPARFAPTVAPSQLTAVAVSETRIDLTWRDNSDNETSFEIDHSWNGATGNFFHLATVSANTVATSHQGLQAESQHCYQVRAVQAIPTPDGGTIFFYSPATATVCATTPVPSAPPPAGYVVSARPAGSTRVVLTVTWTLASRAPLFRIYRSTSGGAPWELISAPGSDDWYLDEPVLSEQQVCYRIVAYNAAGDAAPSSPDCTTPPARPTLVSAVVAADTLELIWTDNSAVEEGYEVWVVCQGSSEDPGWFEGEWLVTVLPPNSTSWRVFVDPPIPNVSLGYFVVARKDGGGSDPIGLFVW